MKTACILNYNNAETFKRSIDTLLNEPDTEIIICDNNSTDGSRELIKSYGDRIKSILRTEMVGQSKNRNDMVRETTGEWILALDADILYEAGSFDWLIKAFTAKGVGKNVVSVGFSPWNFSNRESEKEKFPPTSINFYTNDIPIIPCQYGVFKREVFESGIWYDEEYGTGYGFEDNDLAFQYREKGYDWVFINYKFFHNKNTPHWYEQHRSYPLRYKERGKLFEDKWGKDVWQKYYHYPEGQCPDFIFNL